MNIFDRYAPFVQDYIYQNGWESLRAIQVAAAQAIFQTDDHVLLTASTASGILGFTRSTAARTAVFTSCWPTPR